MIGMFLFFHDSMTAALVVAFGIVASGVAAYAGLPQLHASSPSARDR